MIIVAIDRAGETHALNAAEGDVLMEVLRDNGLGVEAVCGGACACATCHVFIDAPGARGADEEALVSVTEHFDVERSRLSCQIQLGPEHKDLKVSVAPED